MGSSQQPPLDEIQWNHPLMVQEIGGITTNTGDSVFSLSSYFPLTYDCSTTLLCRITILRPDLE